MAILQRLFAGYLQGLTSFFSLEYLMFFLPLAILGYSLTPGKLKRYALLLGSLGFQTVDGQLPGDPAQKTLQWVWTLGRDQIPEL